MPKKSSAFKEAPPIRPPSTSGLENIDFALAGLTLPPYKIETVSVRIYSCLAEPKDHRILSTWLSYDDLRSLILACINSSNVQHSIIFGVSNNDSVLIDNKYAKHIGYKPKDNAEEFRSLIEKKDGFIDSTDSLVTTHGGYFASSGHFDD